MGWDGIGKQNKGRDPSQKTKKEENFNRIWVGPINYTHVGPSTQVQGQRVQGNGLKCYVLQLLHNQIFSFSTDSTCLFFFSSWNNPLFSLLNTHEHQRKKKNKKIKWNKPKKLPLKLGTMRRRCCRSALRCLYRSRKILNKVESLVACFLWIIELEKCLLGQVLESG